MANIQQKAIIMNAQDLPYTIIVDGSGNCEERKLADHDPGAVLTPSSLSVVSNQVF